MRLFSLHTNPVDSFKPTIQTIFEGIYPNLVQHEVKSCSAQGQSSNNTTRKTAMEAGWIFGIGSIAITGYQDGSLVGEILVVPAYSTIGPTATAYVTISAAQLTAYATAPAYSANIQVITFKQGD